MSERFKDYKRKLRRKGTMRKRGMMNLDDIPEPYSPQGDRCPMCKSHRLIYLDSTDPQSSLICPECGWAGERANIPPDALPPPSE